MSMFEPCPSSPNCVCSTASPDDSTHYLAPLSYSVEDAEVIHAVSEAITSAGGTVTATTSTGVDATFRTKILRFTDDVLFRLDEDEKLLHFRSASRVGYSDLGTNRKRMNTLLPAIRDAIS